LGRGKRAQKQGLDVNRAIASAPFQALQAASKVIRRTWLTAAIARQEGGSAHAMQKS
jgi:hypothetical protein